MKEKIKKIIECIERNEKIALFPHTNIDGDSFSSSYGLAIAIKKAYPQKQVKWIADMKEMKTNFPMLSIDENIIGEKIDNSWLAIVGDTSSKSKLKDVDMIESAKEIIVFDHHRNDIEIKHDIFWHEPNYPASSIQAIEIVEELDVELDETIAFNLMIGLLTDTGNFTYSLADEKPVNMYGKMLKFISNETMDEFWRGFKSRSARDIELTKLFLNNLKYSGKVAYVYFDLDLAERFSDINYKLKISQIANIEGYPIWCFFVEVKEDGVLKLKLHFRSNGPNVSKLAIKKGGGGHLRAAGATVKLEENTLEEVLTELNKEIK